MSAGIIVHAMESKLLAGAGRAAASVAGIARHVAWYLSYQLDLGEGARNEERRPIGNRRPATRTRSADRRD